MRKLLRCRRGSVALATVIVLVPLIVVVALGAEAGSWYATKQHAQGAADAAAISAGMAVACSISGSTGCDTDYVGRGKEFAAQNGFCNAGDSSYPASNCALPKDATRTVDIKRGTFDFADNSWTDSASGNFVRAIVSQQQHAYLAALVLGKTVKVAIPATAIAEVQDTKQVCALGLGPSNNALTVGGSSNITGNGCALMSDNTVKFNSTPHFTGPGWAVDAVGGCIASTGHCDLSVPYNYSMLPATDPLSVLNSKSFNSWTGTGNADPRTKLACPSPLPSLTPPIPATTNKCYTMAPNSGGGSTAAYTKLTVQNNEWVNFAPGTYIFYNAAINITGGYVSCTTCTSTAGVTLVLLGTNNAGLSISGGAIVTLNAPATNAFSSDLNGVLIDDQVNNTGGNNSNNAVNINGGTLSLGGAMYFPHVDVSWGGQTTTFVQNSNTACTEVVANTITINGNAYLSTNQCNPNTIPQTQVVTLVD
jgi:hypothetical protein